MADPEYFRAPAGATARSLGLQICCYRLGLLGTELVCHCAHHRRIAPGSTLEMLDLTQQILLVLPGQPRKRAVALSLGAMAGGTARYAVVRNALFENGLSPRHDACIARLTRCRALARIVVPQGANCRIIKL